MTDSVCTTLGIEHPIILGPFGGLSSIALTAAVSDAGGLGSYGLYGYTGERITETITSLKAATDRPFAVNLWLPTGDEVSVGDVDLTAPFAATAPLFGELGLDVPEPPARFLVPVAEQLEAVLEARPAVLSVVYGTPSPELIAQAHDRGIRITGTVTTVAEAVAMEAAGVDAITVSGSEAAGHRASFLDAAEHSMIGTFSLVPQAVDAVSVPVIAAGGVSDRRGVAAAFALGADGVQVGTAFLRTRESAATDHHRRAIDQAVDTTTRITRAMSGRPGRGIPNHAVQVIEDAGAIAPFPAQNWLTGRFRAEAGARGLGEFSSLWAGQSAGLARWDEAADVFAELVAGVPGPR